MAVKKLRGGKKHKVVEGFDTYSWVAQAQGGEIYENTVRYSTPEKAEKAFQAFPTEKYYPGVKLKFLGLNIHNSSYYRIRDAS